MIMPAEMVAVGLPAAGAARDVEEKRKSGKSDRRET
jgi:hypothetical protein